MYDIVVAHYKEDLSWLPSLIAANAGAVDRVFVYCKGGEGHCPSENELALGLGSAESPPSVRVTAVPNVGREAETYVRHILCEHFSDQPRQRGNHTVFLQGDPRPHLASGGGLRDCALPSAPEEEVPSFRAFFAPPALEETHVWDLDATPWNMPVFRKARQLFELPPRSDGETETFVARFSPGAQYIVSPAAIRARPRGVYEELMRQMHFIDRNVDAWFAYNWRAENHDNIPEILDAWTMERLWPLLFDPQVPVRI